MGQRLCFDPLPCKKCHILLLRKKLLLDNPASFSSSRMKDLCQRWKVKLSLRGAWNSLMAWPDWPWPAPAYFMTDLHHCLAAGIKFTTTTTSTTTTTTTTNNNNNNNNNRISIALYGRNFNGVIWPFWSRTVFSRLFLVLSVIHSMLWHC